jgi:hypothetical protein
MANGGESKKLAARLFLKEPSELREETAESRGTLFESESFEPFTGPLLQLPVRRGG